MSLPDWLTTVLTIGPVFVVPIVAVWSSAWAYHDARQRGKHPLLVAIFVLLAAWPLGLIAWLVFRPDRWRRPPFNLDDFRVG